MWKTNIRHIWAFASLAVACRCLQHILYFVVCTEWGAHRRESLIRTNKNFVCWSWLFKTYCLGVLILGNNAIIRIYQVFINWLIGNWKCFYKIEFKYKNRPPIKNSDFFNLHLFGLKSSLAIFSSARFLPMIGDVLQMLQMLVALAVCLLTFSLQTSHITCPTWTGEMY